MSTSASSHTFTEIPIIDIGPLVDPAAAPGDLQRAVDEIGAACLNVGFFYVRNHGIPESHRGDMLREMERFFALPEAQKMELHIGKSTQFRGYVPLRGEVTSGKQDWHECIDLQPLAGRGAAGGHPLDDPGQWPVALPSFRQVMMRSWDELYTLSGRIAEGMALSLGLDRHYFDPFAGGELCSLRLLHYPPFIRTVGPDQVDAGFGAHVDYGFLAVLQQDEVGGLEVQNADGEWILAQHIPGTFLVNIGLMMQRWTNDRYRATWHRVQLPQGQGRYSMPFFYEPRYDAVVEPLAVCVDEDNPPRYEPARFGDMVTEWFSRAYGERAAASEPAEPAGSA